MNDVKPVDLLTPAAKAKAVKAIEAMHLAYYEKDVGLRSLYEKAQKQLENTSKHIFRLAQDAHMAADGDFVRAQEIYLQMCRYAEASYKKSHDVNNVYETLPVWRVFKSNILRGLKNEVDPLEFTSESAYRKATTDLIMHPGGGFSSLQVEQIQEWLNTVTIPKDLRPHLSKMLALVEFLRQNRVHDAEEILSDTVERLA